MITTQLNHERVGIAAWAGFAQEMWDAVAGGPRRPARAGR